MQFEIAKIYWRTFFPAQVDGGHRLHGTPAAMKLDLNDRIDLERQFDIVMNLGTVEHVFNVAQAMKTIHDHSQPAA